MPAEWTSEVVGQMHQHRITRTALAAKLGFTLEYVCMVLNGKREVEGHEDRFRNALNELIREKEAQVLNTGA